jgi:8-oxo-dGTP diphosphatase
MSGKAYAYGGVVIDADGRILLREPKGHYDGFVWTFPKGRPNEGETKQEAALRETEEETGVIAEIVAPVPGQFEGGTTINEYFLMRPTGRAHQPENETDGVCWVSTPDKAREMINETTNIIGRERDLKVLEAALAGREDLR